METTSTHRTPYPSGVSDDEGAFVAPYLTLMTPDAPQRHYDLREVFNALRWLVRSGAPWRMLPHDFPRWEAVYQQTQHWLQAGCFAAIVEDLRLLLRLAQGRTPQLSAAIFDSQTLQSSPESGTRAGYDGHKRKERIQAPPGSRYPWTPPGLACHASQRTGSGPGRCPGGGGPGGHWRARRAGVCRSGVHRPGGGGGCRRAWPRTPCGQAGGSQAGFRPLAASLGGRVLLRLEEPLPALGPRLRVAAGDGQGLAFRRLQLSHVVANRLPPSRSITASSGNPSVWPGQVLKRCRWRMRQTAVAQESGDGCQCRKGRATGLGVRHLVEPVRQPSDVDRRRRGHLPQLRLGQS